MSRYSSWRSYHDYGNGLLADILTHWADVAQWLHWRRASRRARSALGGDFELSGDLTNPDTVSADRPLQGLEPELRVDGAFNVAIRQPSVYFEGTEGTLDITREGYVFTPNSGEPVEVKATSLEQAHAGNFIDAIVKTSKGERRHRGRHGMPASQ